MLPHQEQTNRGLQFQFLVLTKIILKSKPKHTKESTNTNTSSETQPSDYDPL
jgi:hypothetical protein